MHRVIRKKADITEELLRPSHMTEEAQRAWAIDLLQRKAGELGHPPRKADIGDVDKLRIKAVLGPWPRALEAAGLKERRKKP